MSDVKRIATRESYGKALVELGKLHEDLVVPRCRPCRSYEDSDVPERIFRSATLTVGLRKEI